MPDEANDSLILLVSLAFIDFVYAAIQFPLLIYLIVEWNNEVLNYNPYVIYWLGGSSAALMKSGCTVTTAIAIDRVIALNYPVVYYGHSKRKWSLWAFALSVTLAFIDFIILLVMVDVVVTPGCSGFPCFVTKAFRIYWGLSNMIMNLLSCIFTVFILFHLCKISTTQKEELNKIEKLNRTKVDKNANRVALYILLVSAVIGVIPGCLNGVGNIVELEILAKVNFYVGLCATLSGLSHAFIFAMAHRHIKEAIHTKVLLACIPFKTKIRPLESDTSRMSRTISMQIQTTSFQVQSLPSEVYIGP